MNRLITQMMDELSKHLTKDDMILLKRLLAESEGHEIEVLQDLMSYTYDHFPVPVQEFIEGEEYLNLKGAIYPRIRDDLIELFEGDYIEAVFTGGIGWGKSTMGTVAMARMIYEVSCFKNPQRAFGLMDNTSIVFINVSVNEANAKKVVFQDLKRLLNNSPYFKYHFQFDKNLDREMRFPKNILVFPAASTESNLIGYNVIGGIIDECVPAGTMVATPSGEVPIEDLRPGDLVIGWDGRFQPDVVIEQRMTGLKPCRTFIFNNGEKLTCSDDHPLMVWNNGKMEWTRARWIKKGDMITTYGTLSEPLKRSGPRVTKIIKEPEPIKVYNLETGTHAYVANRFLVHNCNFMDVVENSKRVTASGTDETGRYDHAQALYTALIRRMKSRFMKHGKLPGKLIMISSSRYPDDFTERKLKEAKDDPTIFVRRYAQWDTKPPGTYSEETFTVALGDAATRPQIVDNEETRKQLEARGIELIEVPIDYLPDFRRDIDGAIRDIAGRPLMTVRPFIVQREKIFDAIQRAKEKGLAHPFTAEVTTLTDGAHLVPELLHPNDIPRFIHVDLSLSGDATGFAMGHVSHYVEVERRNSEGNIYREMAPHIVIDLALRIVAPKNGEIQVANVRSLIYELRSLGFNIQLVTFDQFQSASTIQELNRVGIKADNLSVDRSMEPYNALKDALYEDRLTFYEYKPLIQELVALEKNEVKNKVDHPAKGSKDVADAVAGVCYHCSTQKPRALVVPSWGYMEGEEEVKKPEKSVQLDDLVDDEDERPNDDLDLTDELSVTRWLLGL